MESPERTPENAADLERLEKALRLLKRFEEVADDLVSKLLSDPEALREDDELEPKM